MSTMTKQNAYSVLKEMKSHSYGDVSAVTEISREDALFQEEKSDIQSTFIYHDRMRRYCEYLSKEPDLWPSNAETDESLKVSRRERTKVKEQLEEVTDKLSEILQTVCTEYDQLKVTVKTLEEKLKIFENKKALFESRRKIDPQSAQTAVDKCQQAVEKLEAEILKQTAELSRLDTTISELRSQVNKKSSVHGASTGDQLIKRAHKVLSFLETVAGIRLHEAGTDHIQLEFLKSGENAKTLAEEEEFSLFLTLTVHNVCGGDIQLTDVKVTFGEPTYISVDHFDIKDIVNVAIVTNDIQYLVMSIQDRWLRHFPLLSEMDTLNKHHAVDWIQEQSRLRVLVGKCGKIMFTLNVPKDYPLSRGITLLDSYGIEENEEDKLQEPDEMATLLEWVIYLENKYGDCD